MRAVYKEERTTEYRLEDYEIWLTGLNKHEYTAIRAFLKPFLEGSDRACHLPTDCRSGRVVTNRDHVAPDQTACRRTCDETNETPDPGGAYLYNLVRP